MSYNTTAGGGAGTPQRKTFVDPTTPGDSRNMWGQGMPNPADSVAFWKEGQSATAVAGGGSMSMDSRIQYAGSVSTNLHLATDAREKGRMSFYGSGYSFYGSSPRLTSETIGRDINPLGRGDGMAYVGGMVNLGRITPSLPMNQARVGMGNSVNNALEAPGGGGKNPVFKDCGDKKLPGCCCNVVAADTFGLFAGNHCSSDAVRMACEENGCPDVEACRQAKCALVECYKAHGMSYCTTCDCQGPGGVGSGSGTLPCPSCGSCNTCGDTGILGADIGYKGVGLSYPGSPLGHCSSCGRFTAFLPIPIPIPPIWPPFGYYPPLFAYPQFKPNDKGLLDKAIDLIKKCLQQIVNGKSCKGITAKLAKCMLDHLNNYKIIHGTSGMCCPVKTIFGLPALAAHLWCCHGSTHSAFTCHNDVIMICDQAFVRARASLIKPECDLAFTIMHELAHTCGIGTYFEAWTNNSVYGRINPADDKALCLLRCCGDCGFPNLPFIIFT